jgi:DNA-binding response OmpR family regulator
MEPVFMRKVLIVDDDLMIADTLEMMLSCSGYDVCGVARDKAEAVQLGDIHQPDIAIIDLRLAHGQYGTEVAEALCQHHPVAILYATGNPEHPILNDAPGAGCIGKPYAMDDILAALTIVSNLTLNPDMPPATAKGFRLLNG